MDPGYVTTEPTGISRLVPADEGVQGSVADAQLGEDAPEVMDAVVARLVAGRGARSTAPGEIHTRPLVRASCVHRSKVIAMAR